MNEPIFFRADHAPMPVWELEAQIADSIAILNRYELQGVPKSITLKCWHACIPVEDVLAHARANGGR